MLQLHLIAPPGGVHGPFRPVVRLAAATVLDAMDALSPATVLKDLAGFYVAVTIRRSPAGVGAPIASAGPAVTVRHQRRERLLIGEATFDEQAQVEGPVDLAADSFRIPAAADYAAGFLDSLQQAVDALVAWCDRKQAWLDRDAVVARWRDAAGRVRAGRFSRPYEFAADAAVRDALDACWRLVEATPASDERFEEVAVAYLGVRDFGWRAAEYEADPEQPAGRFGQPARVANHASNRATARPPTAAIGYGLV